MTDTPKLPIKLESTGLQLTNLEDLQRAAKLFLASGMFAEKNGEQDVARACVKILAGQELGLKPFQAMRNIDIVQGQATYRYQLVGAKVKQSGRYDYKVLEASATAARIQFFVDGKPDYVSEFTMEDAKLQRLAGKDGYQRMPADMLFARALTKGVNKVCPEVFFGTCYAPEDFGEMSDREGSQHGREAQAQAGHVESVETVDAEVLEGERTAEVGQDVSGAATNRNRPGRRSGATVGASGPKTQARHTRSVEPDATAELRVHEEAEEESGADSGAVAEAVPAKSSDTARVTEEELWEVAEYGGSLGYSQEAIEGFIYEVAPHITPETFRNLTRGELAKVRTLMQKQPVEAK